MIFATIHGYAAAWLAVRMLFRPYQPVKFLGLTVWPQGMIPRHRARLAQSIGKAVGNELVSQDTVVHALFETNFFQRKIEGFVESYTREVLNTTHPSVLDALPAGARESVLDAISALQYRVADYIAAALQNAETIAAINEFIDRRVDGMIDKRLSEAVDDETIEAVIRFVEERFRAIVSEAGFEEKVRGFVGERLNELTESNATLADMFTPDSVAVIKERLDAQIPPIVQHLAELATQKSTRKTIGALIKREVDDYYEQLSFFKKIFVSRERIHREVDELVNKTLPRRVEEYLRGEAFEQEAEAFLDSTIDNVLSRPLNEIVGQISPDKFAMIKDQVAGRILALARSDELTRLVAAYTTDAVERLRPQTLRELLHHVSPDSADRLKSFLSNGLVSILMREETAKTINAILTTQIERLLVAPIGRLSDHVPEESIRNASFALTERITVAARDRLPEAILEFDIGGIVRNKVTDYPVDRLEALVLSVAAQHLKTIEYFGAIIGFLLGFGQAIFLYFSGAWK